MKNIIVVDMQKGFINSNNCHLIEKINAYLQQNKFDNAIYTKCINGKDSPFVKILNWNGMQDENSRQIVVDILPNSIILEKATYGISNKDIQLLKGKNITEVEICGTDIDACVLAIAFNLFDNGIKPIILKDLCASSSKNKDITKSANQIIDRQF